MKNIVKNPLICLIALLAITVNAQDKNIIEQERDVKNFNKILVSRGIDLELSQGNSEKLVVIASEKMIDKITSEVIDGELQISIDGNYATAKELTAKVMVKNIERLTAKSGSDIESAHVIQADKLSIYCSGGSDIEIQVDANLLNCDLSGGSDAEIKATVKESINVKATGGSDIEATVTTNELICKLAGGSDAELEGNVKGLFITASGGSDIKAKGLTSQDCRLRVSGSSDALVTATNSIDIDASSASDVVFFGDPEQQNVNASGGSDVYAR